MKENRKLAIWMDHSHAIEMELTSGPIMQHSIISEFSFEERASSLAKSEELMHNKEQRELSHYYKKLSDIILDFQEVLLFGPTEAKVELFNLIKANHLFEKIKIEVKDTDVLTENQMHAYAREYFK
jgi:hypothetical protein